MQASMDKIGSQSTVKMEASKYLIGAVKLDSVPVEDLGEDRVRVRLHGVVRDHSGQALAPKFALVLGISDVAYEEGFVELL